MYVHVAGTHSLESRSGWAVKWQDRCQFQHWTNNNNEKEKKVCAHNKSKCNNNIDNNCNNNNYNNKIKLTKASHVQIKMSYIYHSDFIFQMPKTLHSCRSNNCKNNFSSWNAGKLKRTWSSVSSWKSLRRKEINSWKSFTRSVMGAKKNKMLAGSLD